MVFGEYKESYPKKDSEELSVFLIYNIVASKISLFLFVSKRESPYKSISLLILSEKDSKLLETQGSTNCPHGDEHAHKEVKSIKTR